ncbi:MAG: APC family permease [Brasilonema angustatum HA4187-MV1]|nr:APC family permease [Brasilonema angustatum HA4187-MV1]
MTPATNSSNEPPKLQRNTLQLRHAIVMAVAAMSPVGAIFFNSIPQAGLVGAAMPLCYIIGFGVALLVADQISMMAAEFPTSGSLYTFVTQGLGVSWGFLAGWLSLISFGVTIAFVFLVMSANFQELLLHWFDVHLNWTLWYCLFALIVGAVCYRGIRFSLQLDLTLLMFELGVCLLLALIVLMQAGKTRQLTLVPFTLTGLPQHSNLVAGVILSILSFVGFESATTLGEEIQNPRQSIPKATVITLVLVGVFYVLMSYVATLGYGIHNMAAFTQDAAPFDTIARHVWGNGFALLIDFAGIMAGYASAVAFLNAAARIVYAVSREELFPRWLAHIHPTYRTPTNAIFVLSGSSAFVGLGLGMLWTPIQAFGFLGTVLTLAALAIYGLTSLACFRYLSTTRRTQLKQNSTRFGWLRHTLLPWLSMITISGVLVGTLYPPPPAPLHFAPVVVLIWLLLGIGVLRFLQIHKPEAIRRAGRLFVVDEAETLS